MAYRYEKNYNGGSDIVIDGWEKGIAPSPFAGISDIRGLNITDIPGVVFTNGIPVSTTYYPTSGWNDTQNTTIATFVASVANNTIYYAPPYDYIAVTFQLTSGGSMPGGITAGTKYYLKTASGSGPSGTSYLATTLQNAIAGTYVDITSTGSGITMTPVPLTNVKVTANHSFSNVPGFSCTYALDDYGQLWAYNYTTSGAWTLIRSDINKSYGLAVYQDWLFVFGISSVDVYGKLTGAVSTHTYYSGWKNLVDINSTYVGLHKTFVGQDNVLYWTDYDDYSASSNQGYIGSLRSLPGQTLFADTGNPTTSSATTNYSFNNNSLDFPSKEEPVAISELGTNLIIGVNASRTSGNDNYSKLYSWDRVSPSFNFPITIPELPIYEITNLNNRIYVFTGYSGRVYVTDMSSVDIAFSIPNHLMTLHDGTNTFEGMPKQSVMSNTPIDMTFSTQALTINNKLYFGFSMKAASGVYSYDSKTGALQIVTGELINGYGSSTSYLKINAIARLAYSSVVPEADRILFFGSIIYTSGATTQYFCNRFYAYSTNYTSGNPNYLITDLVPVGSNLNKKTLQQIEYKLDMPLVTNGFIQIQYRKQIGDSWTNLTTDNYSNYGSITSRAISISLADAEWIQFRIYLGSYTRLRELRIR